MKTFIGRAMEGLLPHGVSLETNTVDLKIITAIAAVLASVTATLAAVEPDKVQFGLAPLSMAAAEPNNATCAIASSQIIAWLEPNALLREAHRQATSKVAVARAPVIALR